MFKASKYPLTRDKPEQSQVQLSLEIFRFSETKCLISLKVSDLWIKSFTKLCQWKSKAALSFFNRSSFQIIYEEEMIDRTKAKTLLQTFCKLSIIHFFLKYNPEVWEWGFECTALCKQGISVEPLPWPIAKVKPVGFKSTRFFVWFNL